MTAAAVAVAAALALVRQPAPVAGEWRGTSLCVDKAKDPACHDEQVVYQFTRVAGRADSMALAASKIVAGRLEPMGDLGLHWEAKTSQWVMEFTAPNGFHGLWAFRPAGDRLTGSLTELPSGRLVRRVDAKRS